MHAPSRSINFLFNISIYFKEKKNSSTNPSGLCTPIFFFSFSGKMNNSSENIFIFRGIENAVVLKEIIITYGFFNFFTIFILLPLLLESVIYKNRHGYVSLLLEFSVLTTRLVKWWTTPIKIGENFLIGTNPKCFWAFRLKLNFFKNNFGRVDAGEMERCAHFLSCKILHL